MKSNASTLCQSKPKRFGKVHSIGCQQLKYVGKASF